MGDVISFEVYKDNDKEILIVNNPCDRPFHIGDYIRNLRCVRCNVSVQLNQHPSLPEPRWYG